MSPWLVYLILQLDHLRELFGILSVILVFPLMFTSMILEGEPNEAQKAKEWLKRIIIALIVCLLCIMFIPSTKDMLIILASQLEGIQQLPQDLVDALRRILEQVK